MKTRAFLIAPVCCAAVVAMAPLNASAFLDKILPTKTETKDGDAKMDLKEYKGLKHAIGVVNFDNDAGCRPTPNARANRHRCQS